MVIANLNHSSPRIPSIFGHLGEDWDVTFLTYELDTFTTLNEIYENNKLHIEVASCKGDIFWWIRKYIFKSEPLAKNSYSESLKTKTPFKLTNVVNILMRLYLSMFGVPDSNIPCLSSLKNKATELAALNNYDLVYSSSPYPIVHFVAAHLKKSYPNMKWIAEFRDLWTLNHNYPFGLIRKTLDAFLEKRVLKRANSLVTISAPLADLLGDFHNKSVEVIPNGFSPSDLQPIFQQKNRMVISYTGVIYEGKQDPEKILLAISQLIDEGVIEKSKIVLNFYGRYNEQLETLIEQYSIKEVVFQCGYKSWSQIRNVQHNSDLLLLLQWEDAQEIGIFPLKMFEYLDAGKTILATGGGEHNYEINEILTRTNAGIFAFDIESIKKNLRIYYQEFVDDGFCSYSGNRKEIMKHSYLAVAKTMSNYLEKVTDYGK